MAIGIFRPNRGKPLEQRIRDIEQHLASLSLDAETIEQLLGSGSGFGGGGGGGAIRLPLPESQVKWDPTSGHIHDGTDAEGAKLQHTNLDTTGGSALLDGGRHSDTAAATPVRGDLVKGNSTPAWDRLAIGASGRVLKSDGTDPAWGQVAHSELSGTGSALLDGANHSDTLAGTVVAGDLITGNATPKWSRLAKGTAGHFLKVGAAILEWAQVTFLDITGSLTEAQHGNLTSAAGSDADHSGTLSANARVAVKKNGTLVATRRGVNFIEGTNVTLTVADDSGNEEVDITIAQSSVSAGTIIVQEGDTTVDAAASTLDFAAADFNVTSDPAGEVNIEWQGLAVQNSDANIDTACKTLDFSSDFTVTSSPAGEANVTLAGLTVKEGPTSHTGVRILNLGNGFDTSLAGTEVSVSLDLSEIITGDLSMTGNAALVTQIRGAGIANPTSTENLKGLAYQSSDDSFQYQGRDFAIDAWSHVNISVINTTDLVMTRVGGGGTNINVPWIPIRAGAITGISVAYDGNVDAASDSHTITLYVNGVATALTLTTTGPTDKNSVDALAAGTQITFAANDELELYHKRTGSLNSVGCQVTLFGVWTA